jgi:putative membrane protein
MRSAALAVIAIVALLHVWFLIMEMFLWTKPFGLKQFKMSAEKAEATAVLAQNQGLYNGFLAAGLVWALFGGAELEARACFFLGCVAVAGIYGAITAARTILYVQALPAILGLLLLWISR